MAFVAKWERLSRSEKHGEAGDTAVREAVATFHAEVYEAVMGAHASAPAWQVWVQTRDLARERVRVSN